MVLNVNSTLGEYRLALALTILPENLGNLDPTSTFVQSVKKELHFARR